MVKNLRYVLMSMLVMLGMSAMAQTEFDFDTNGVTLLGLPGESSGSGATAVTDGDITEAKTATIGAYSLTVSAGVPDSTGKVKTPNRLWNTAPKLRLYSGKLNIISSGENFKSIVFTLATQASKAKWNESNTASVGTINTEAKTTITWSGDAKEVEFTIAGNTQISKITISTEGGDITPEPQPEPGDSIQTTGKGTLESPYTTADAIKVVGAMTADQVSTSSYYIKGKISSIKYTFSAQYGTATFNISDQGDTIAANQFICYSVYYLENKSWAEGNTQVAVGDDVIIYGQVVNYRGNTPETSSKKAYIYSLNGVTKNEGGDPDPQPVDNNVSVAEALTIIAGLANSAKTTEDYTVKGYVIKVTEISTQYGNATFTIADAAGDSTNVLTVYRAKNAVGENITDENLLKAGDLVEVQGKLQKYVSKDSIMTPEVAQNGKILTVNGQATGISEFKSEKRFDGAIYNLKGQRISVPARGLFIRNGRKFFVK